MRAFVPEPEYTLSEIISRLPWVEDESAIVSLPVDACGFSGQHEGHVFIPVGSLETAYYCLGVEASS